MEETSLSPDQIAEQFIDLIQRFIGIRINLTPPEHIIRFKDQIEKMNPGGGVRLTDFFLLFRVFAILERRETIPTMGEMSAELNVPLSSATRIVDWLVGTNIVERVNDPDDRRIVRVRLTETGQQLYRTEMAYRKLQIMRLIANFSPEEQEQLLRLMNKVLDTLIAQS